MIIHMHANLNTIVVLGHLKTIIFLKFKMKKKMEDEIYDSIKFI